MGILQRKTGQVFLKEDSDIGDFISKMKELENQVTDKKLKFEIQEQINYATYGENGEKSVIFELKNSGMDMYVLRDIYLEYEDLYAQIDFLIVTRKKVFVLECKNMYGNINVDEKGNFTRVNKWKGTEGIYSPVTQNQRHMNIIRNIRSSTKGNFLTKAFFERNFENNYIALVVIANDKTVINAEKAPKDIMSHVIKKDQLNKTIRDINDSSKDPEYTDAEMKDLAQFFLDMSTSNKSDYTERYRRLAEAAGALKTSAPAGNVGADRICPKCGNKLVIRTVNKGENIGKQFYGCSNFPKCWYKEDIVEDSEPTPDSGNTTYSSAEETEEERKKRWEEDWEN